MGWQFLAGLASLLAFGEEPRALLLPGGEHRFGFGEPGGQRARGRPGGVRVAVLVGRLLVQGPQRVQAAKPRNVFLAGRPQLGGGRRGIGAGEDLDLRPGLVLSGPGLGQRIAGAFGLTERPGGLGGAGSGGELSVQRVDGGLGRGQRVVGAEGLGAAELAVGQALRVALAVLGPIELGAAGADLGLAGGGRRGGGPGQPGGPGGVGQRAGRPGRRGIGNEGSAGDAAGSAPATWATRAASSRTACSAISTWRAEERRRSASHFSTLPNRSVPNSFSSSSALFSASACRNCANWPWGSNTTW